VYGGLTFHLKSGINTTSGVARK